MAQTLLIAEDDEKDRVLLVHALESAGVTNPVKLVKSGAELTKYLMGLGAFKDRVEHPLPGLILLDMNLNGLGGQRRHHPGAASGNPLLPGETGFAGRVDRDDEGLERLSGEERVAGGAGIPAMRPAEFI